MAGLCGFFEGIAKIAKSEAISQGLGQTVGILNIAAGVCTIGTALSELIGGDHSDEAVAGNICDLFSGLLDVAAGIAKVSVVGAALAIPLGIMSATFSIAGGFFKKGEWGAGVLTLLIGTATTVVVCVAMRATLKKAFSALMKAIMSAFKLTASPLALNPVTVTAAVAIIALIAVLLAKALSNLNFFAQGGFPAPNRPFIAREVGPELVGTISGRNAVINNDQIVAAVSQGVYRAFMAGMNESAVGKSSMKARVFLDGKQIAVAGAN